MSNPFTNMPKPAVYATVIGGTLATGFILYLRHQKTGSWNPFSASTTPASDNATPDSSAASSTADTSGLGTDAGGGTGTLASIPSYGSSADLATSSPYTLNATYPSAAQWAQAAQAGLTSIGYDPVTVAAALGAYIAQKPLTAAQESIVQVAVAEYGQPDGANGMPLQILTQPAVTPTGATEPPGVPTLSVTPYPEYADFGWSAESGATGYELVVTGAGGKGTGTSHFDETVIGNHVEKLALAKGNYIAYVRSKNTAGESAWSAHKAFTIKTASKINGGNPPHVGKA